MNALQRMISQVYIVPDSHTLGENDSSPFDF